MTKWLACLVPLLMNGMTVASQTTHDFSDSTLIEIDEPQLARVNITGVEALPTGKEDNLHAWLEYSDEAGNYFRKRIILNAQGNIISTMTYPKKNLSIEFCEDEWVGEETTGLKIGHWVKQDEFHFKACWLDSFRGGLAVANGYKIYSDITADETPIMERAGLTGYSKKALCHPDGFPCVISLNGEFQGVYAWQLRKHRKNMGLKKDNSRNVHFELLTYTNSLESGQIDWNAIEVRNPKPLTDEAQGYIEQFARYHNELEVLSSTLSNDRMRDEIAQRYDVTSIIDYIIFGLVTANIDGFGKNTQFFTYDGQKWFITPYDLDETFGNTWIDSYQFPAQWTFVNADYRMLSPLAKTPYCWIHRYFWNEVEQRYAQLRDTGVLTAESMTRHLHDWNERVGKDNYDKEYARWATCPSQGRLIVNDGWEAVDDWTDYYTTASYEDNHSYATGERVLYKHHIWQAATPVKGVAPFSQGGYCDTEERVGQWLTERISLEDEFLGYVEGSGITTTTTPSQHRHNIKVLHNGRMVIINESGEAFCLGGYQIR